MQQVCWTSKKMRRETRAASPAKENAVNYYRK